MLRVECATTVLRVPVQCDHIATTKGTCCCCAMLCALYVARGFHKTYCCALVKASQVDVGLLVRAHQKQDIKQAPRQANQRCLTDQMAALDAW